MDGPKPSWVLYGCSDGNSVPPDGVHMLLHDNGIQKILNAPQLNGFLTGGAVILQAFSDGWSEAILGIAEVW